MIKLDWFAYSRRSESAYRVIKMYGNPTFTQKELSLAQYLYAQSLLSDHVNIENELTEKLLTLEDTIKTKLEKTLK